MAPTASQRYLSTRGGSYGFSFEETVLKGLAADNGLFIPEAIPALPSDWVTAWENKSFEELAFEIFSLFVSPEEIPADDLRDLISRSYSTFREPAITPLRPLDPEKNIYLLELFHGPTFAFKDVALQFVGNLFEYFLQRKNKNGSDSQRHTLTVIGATSGDTGSAAIYGLRGKKDVSVFILHPYGRVSPIQEAQMTTVLDSNVHNLTVDGTFDDCQDIVKSLFSHPTLSKTQNLGAVNSINWARILAQIVYYFSSYFALLRSPGVPQNPTIRYVVPTGNFGDILAGYFAKRMGLPIDRLVIATNANDILYRFMRSARYEKAEGEGGAVKETLSPAMDILVSSNFERLLYYLALEDPAYGNTPVANSEPSVEAKRAAGETVNRWMSDLKTSGCTHVPHSVLEIARRNFEAERVDDQQTVETISHVYAKRGYILDPHSAVGVTASISQAQQSHGDNARYVSLATAHPAKFRGAVDRALMEYNGYDFDRVVRPAEFQGLEGKEKKVKRVKADVEEVRAAVEEGLREEGKL